ncbi:hypothetical protein E3G66_000163 [Mycobacteroides abscessus]|nr:hypothetical protein [Mycobacteroides abscessus]MBE5514483.1 hypothetical protein [Mycobacteroides abscessus]QOF31298.1 hypothetical protein E3G57_000172 [Mycobacteroides abscessus]QOF36035.1 hypothetical protein E3G66_000163 [Mycobacteroides abscessus]SKT93284.1 Uncharacterised protein [Mycobacteroides abscessus subsp. abscessus]
MAAPASATRGANTSAISALRAPALRTNNFTAGKLSKSSRDTSVLSGFSHACS